MPRGMGGHSPSNIAHHLKGIHFPVNRQDLVNKARDNNAPQDVIDVLEQMPDRQYTNMAEMMKGVGEAE